jgi:hypothetical protein
MHDRRGLGTKHRPLTRGTRIARTVQMVLSRGSWVLVYAILVGCGSEVIVDDEPDRRRDPITEPTPGDGGSGNCVPCGVADCGLCALEGGDLAFQCHDGVSPPTDADCVQTGNLFETDGEFYACWRCWQ